MDLQYHVDLLIAVNHEHHKALLEEAAIERYFHQQPYDGAASKFNKVLGQVLCHVSVLRTRITQV